MEPLDSARWPQLIRTDAAVDEKILRHLTAPSAAELPDAARAKLKKSGRRLHSHALTQALLTDLCEVSLLRLGEDPLARFDTPLAFVAGGMPRIYSVPSTGMIVLSEDFLQAIELMAALAALTNLVRRLRKELAGDTADVVQLRRLLQDSHSAVYGLVQARLLLHLTGERKAPALASLLPKSYMQFVHQQTALCIVFALLHEQAHIVFTRSGEQLAGLDPAAGPSGSVSAQAQVIIEAINGDKAEEFAADRWAVDQVGAGRSTLIKAATFFFLNQWIFDAIAHRNEGGHPAAFNRIVALTSAFPEFGEKDPVFDSVVRTGLFGQERFRKSMAEPDTRKRYAQMLKFVRGLSDFGQLEDLVSALSNSYRQAFRMQ